jgi:RNA-binding protein
MLESCAVTPFHPVSPNAPRVNELTPTQRRALRARAHHLQPVVMVGEAGLTPQVIHEIDANLKNHELIKMRVLGEDRATRRGLLEAICEATGAIAVQHIGKILVLYRPRPPEDEKQSTRRPRRPRRAPRRTKRSYPAKARPVSRKAPTA